MAETVVMAESPAVIRDEVGRTYLQTEWDRATKRLCVIHTQRRFFIITDVQKPD